MYIWLTVVFVVTVDRLSKIVIQQNMHLGQSTGVIPGFFHLTYILNPGAAFGMLSGKQWFFILTAVFVLGVIFYYQRIISGDQKLLRVCMGMIGGGALGNLYDRLLLGKVVDFLDFKVWPYIFNFADSMIVIGGFLLVFCIYKMEKKPVE
ncbi:MAG: Lipoprotein signal peptidase [Candidatus Dichloromethanomonas elyunquensis]|nr:MAG: Lipoprotein signal peptidase [Candidatus Dichloromethanomonas elyunquensis]